MNTHKFFTGRAVVFFVLAALALLVWGFSAFNGYIYNQKQSGPAPEPYNATLAGKYVCLPHADTSGPQTLECAFGLQTAAGEYYGLDFALLSTVIEPTVGEEVTLSGIVAPLEHLEATDRWRIYNIEGVMMVSNN